MLGDLEALVSTAKVDYIAIGSNFYEIKPSPAPILMDAMAKFTDLLEDARARKVEKYKAIDPELDAALVVVHIQDLVSDPAAAGDLQDVLQILLDGVEKEDIDTMNIGQMLNSIDKAIKINIDTLPDSFKQQFNYITAAAAVQEDAETEETPPEDTPADAEAKNP